MTDSNIFPLLPLTSTCALKKATTTTMTSKTTTWSFVFLFLVFGLRVYHRMLSQLEREVVVHRVVEKGSNANMVAQSDALPHGTEPTSGSVTANQVTDTVVTASTTGSSSNATINNNNNNNSSSNATTAFDNPLIQSAIQVMTYEPWSDMDWSEGHATCGSHKCFYRSRTQPTMGYLVARRNSWDAMHQVYSLEEELHQQFGIQRISLEEPTVLGISHDQLRILKKYVFQPGRTHESRVYWSEDTQVTVQKVNIVPSPYMFLGTKPKNYEATRAAVADFRPLIPDPKAFSRQFLLELDRMEKILISHQDLIKDFQVLIDTQGRFYWIDLDRIQEKDRYIQTSLSLEQQVAVVSRNATDILFLLVL